MSKLQKQMVSEADLILKSVDWLELQINKKLLEFEKNLDDQSIIDKLDKEIKDLLVKLNKEKDNMDSYMIKFTKLVKKEKDEKTQILYNSKQKKSS